MESLLYIYLFLFGLIFGSFYNVVGIRLAHGESIVHPRSHCPYCGHTLTATELIPVLSWILQKGRCRQCKASVSAQYPLFEFVTASLFTISPLLTGWSKDLLCALFIVSFVVIVTISLLDSSCIPRQIVCFFGITGVIIRLWDPIIPWWDVWLGAIVGFLLYFLIAAFTKGRFYTYDAAYLAVIGLYVGMWGMLAILLIVLCLQLLSQLLNAMLRKKRKQATPFILFVGIAALLVFYLRPVFLHY